MSGYLIFGGIDSRDYDVFVSFSDIDTVPRRIYTKVDIVGKNGAVLIDEGKYEDVPHSYDCIVLDNEKRVAFVNAIMSKKGYQRLTDSYGTDEYYTAVLEENIEQKTTRIRDKYKFKLVFTRKPQRFLTSGEEPVDTSELGGEVTTDNIPYLFRRSGGGNIGHDFDAEIDKIVGGTVAWNQQLQRTFVSANNQGVNGYVRSNRCSFSYDSASNTVVLTSLQNQGTSGGVFNKVSDGAPLIVGHKYYQTAKVKAPKTFNFGIGFNASIKVFNNLTANTFNKVEHIAEFSNTAIEFLFNFNMSNSWDGTETVYITDFMLIDLTQAFGTAIADYVYSLEQTASGSGIAWLKSHGFLTKAYYAYDSGSLQSVKTSEHRTSGKNLFNKAVYTKSGWTLYAKNPLKGLISAGQKASFSINKLDSEAHGFSITVGNSVGGSAIATIAGYTFGNTTLSATSMFTQASIDAEYICLNGNWNGLTADMVENANFQIEIGDSSTSYEPYHINSYPLDSDLELRGLFKLDANNNLYAGGDVYESSGAVTRKYGIVDLGTLNWEYESGRLRFNGVILNMKSVASWNAIGTIISNGFTNAIVYSDTSIDKAYAVYGVGIYIRDTAYTDAQTFKTAMSGVYLVYELATPTTEQADPYASPQVVNPLGTEEYIDTRNVPVPVGHETKYGMSQIILTNPTEFPSKPLLEVTGVGTFWLGDTQFTITGTAGQTIYIDCETGEAWKNVGGVITPANGLVSLNRLDFPELDPGDTPVMYGTGIKKVVVTPRWWRL